VTTLTPRTGPVAADPTRDRERREGAAQQSVRPREPEDVAVLGQQYSEGQRRRHPVAADLPEACSPPSSRNHCSVRPAGRVSQITRAGAEPGFHI
jgi:hypothetical protein